MPDDRLPARTPASLVDAFEAAHGGALEQLAGTTPETGYRAIARLSCHLAAVRRAVCTAPRAPRELVAGCCDQGRQVEWALRLLQCCLAGDMFACGLSLDALCADVGRYLDAYLAAERALAAWLETELPAGDRERLAAGYRHCLGRGPTRPHPRGPRTGPGYRLMFGFHAFWDRLLDTVDSRPGVGRGYAPAA